MKTENSLVSSMFNAISSRYDRINTVLSLGLDRYWRKEVSKLLPQKQKLKLLDCATGTGTQLYTLLTRAPHIYEAVGIDPAEKMLELAKERLAPFAYKSHLITGTAESIPFPDQSFDVVTISFGIRNVQELKRSLQEMYRVLNPQGRLIILEFSHPTSFPIRSLHRFYLNQVLPKMGSYLSKNKEAYSYLSKTIEQFPQGKDLCQILEQEGFVSVRAKPLTFGTVTLYVGEKPC